MMVWINFPLFGLITVIFLVSGVVFVSVAFKRKLLNILGHVCIIIGTGTLILF